MLLTLQQRLAWIKQTKGSSGPQAGREESISFQTMADGHEEVSIFTTRGATVADLLESDRPVLNVELKGETYVIHLPASEYKMGGILGALRSHRVMTEDQRAAAGDRLRAARDRRLAND